DLAATRTAASSLARGPVCNAITAHRHSMSSRIKICRDVGGTWSVHGRSPVPVSDFRSLSASIDYARQACNAAPATIELYVDGMYIVAHQERGWPKALVASLKPGGAARSPQALIRAEQCHGAGWPLG